MIRWLVFIFILLCAVPVKAEVTLDMESFALIPVQHEGRIKPIDSFARAELQRLHDKESFNGKSAIDWLAESFFAPDKALQERIVLVSNRAVRQKLGLPDQEKYFSAADVFSALQAKENLIVPLMKQSQKEKAEQELLQLAGNVSQYFSLLDSFAVLHPLKEGANAPTYIDLVRNERMIQARVKALVRRKGDNPDVYNKEEMALAKLALQMERVRIRAKDSQDFRIVPSQKQNSQEWRTLFSVLADGRDESFSYLKNWQKLAESYRSKDISLWKETSKQILSQSHVLAGFDAQQKARIKLERLYKIYKPFNWTVLLYGVGLFVFLLIPRLKARACWLASRLFEAGMMVHAAGIIARIIILERPPVGTLYESLLFVSWIVSVFCYAITFKVPQSWYRFAGFMIALFLLIISSAFYNGDSLEVLIAVLNTNFWLATHVICITIAYGVCIVAAVFAHLVLLQQAVRPDGTVHQEQILRKILLGALFLTSFGTVLGGIWADQSWGRFWGWDPKENGALLIVLWIVWILHGRMSGKIKGIYFIAATAVLLMIVALSWFGVNLLSTGLHAYGFISGIAYSLALFCGIEIVFIASCLWKRHAASRLA